MNTITPLAKYKLDVAFDSLLQAKNLTFDEWELNNRKQEGENENG